MLISMVRGMRGGEEKRECACFSPNSRYRLHREMQCCSVALFPNRRSYVASTYINSHHDPLAQPSPILSGTRFRGPGIWGLDFERKHAENRALLLRRIAAEWSLAKLPFDFRFNSKRPAKASVPISKTRIEVSMDFPRFRVNEVSHGKIANHNFILRPDRRPSSLTNFILNPKIKVTLHMLSLKYLLPFVTLETDIRDFIYIKHQS